MNIDLFDSDIGMTTEPMPRSLLSKDHGFDDFWKTWPRGDRRVGKPQAKAKWIKLGCANNALHIIAHVEYLKTTEQWQTPKLVPLVCTYLNQCRWLEWEPPEVKPKFTKDPVLMALEEHSKRAVPCPKHLRVSTNGFSKKQD